MVDLDGAPLDGALAALDKIGIKPHAIDVTSPGRFHLYIFVESNFPKKVFKAIQKRLNRLTGGDPNVCDITRVLRTPGSKNLKNDPFLVSILELSEHPRYSYEEIDSKLPKDEPINDPVMERKEQVDVNRPLQDGERTDALVKMIGKLIYHGANNDFILEMCRTWNKRNIDPLPDDKIVKTLESIRSRNDKKLEENKDFHFLNSKYAVIKAGTKTCILDKHDHLNPFITFEDFKKLYSNRYGRDGKLITTSWLNHPQRQQYSAPVFRPCNKVKEDEYNMYAGLAIQPVNGDCSLFLDFILKVICSYDKVLYEYILDWLAFLVQKPYEKPGVALVFRGKEGTGKGTFVRYVGAIFGRHFKHVFNIEQVLGRFNNLLMDCLLLFLDEALWGGDKKCQGILKGLITEPTVMIELKSKDIIPFDSFCHVIIATNNEWSVPAGKDSRRFCVLDVSDAHMQDTAYFGQLHEQMENGGVQALLHFLLERDISNVDIRKVPKTDALLEQKMRTLDPIENWLLDILQEGSLSYEEHGFVKDLGWPDEISKDQLYRCFKAQAVGTVKHVAKSSFCMKLKKLIPAIGEVRRKMANGTRQRMFDLPSLDQCRAAFQDSLGQTIDWEDDE